MLNVWWSIFKDLHMALCETDLRFMAVYGSGEKLLVPDERAHLGLDMKFTQLSRLPLLRNPVMWKGSIVCFKDEPHITGNAPFLFLWTKIKQISLLFPIFVFLWPAGHSHILAKRSSVPRLECCKDFHWVHRRAEILHVDLIFRLLHGISI